LSNRDGRIDLIKSMPAEGTFLHARGAARRARF